MAKWVSDEAQSYDLNPGHLFCLICLIILNSERQVMLSPQHG